jgi:hypothetical protein
MVQALLLSSMDKVNGLYLPVGIKKFVLLDSSFTILEESQTTAEYLVHVKDTSAEDEVN